jgi:hypothetical protein
MGPQQKRENTDKQWSATKGDGVGSGRRTEGSSVEN